MCEEKATSINTTTTIICGFLLPQKQNKVYIKKEYVHNLLVHNFFCTATLVQTRLKDDGHFSDKNVFSQMFVHKEHGTRYKTTLIRELYALVP